MKGANILVILVLVAVVIVGFEFYLANLWQGELQVFNVALDVLIVVLGALLIKAGMGLRGAAFQTIFWGVVLLAFAHMAETFLFLVLPDLEASIQETIHRILVIGGFIALYMAFKQMGSGSSQRA